MVELYQFPSSPFCLVQKRILEYSRAPFKVVNVPAGDRQIIWKLTRQRYYGVPVLKDGRNVIFETDEDSQVISKYLDQKLELGLFPADLEGIQNILWRVIENQVEGFAFRLNNVYYKEWVAKNDLLYFVRHKERKFGAGCLEKWAEQRSELLAGLEESLEPFDLMLLRHDYLIDGRPQFVDFDLYGMLACFLYPGHEELPARHQRLKAWYARISQVKR
jgi:glutathione S-transferase